MMTAASDIERRLAGRFKELRELCKSHRWQTDSLYGVVSVPTPCPDCHTEEGYLPNVTTDTMRAVCRNWGLEVIFYSYGDVRVRSSSPFRVEDVTAPDFMTALDQVAKELDYRS